MIKNIFLISIFFIISVSLYSTDSHLSLSDFYGKYRVTSVSVNDEYYNPLILMDIEFNEDFYTVLVDFNEDNEFSSSNSEIIEYSYDAEIHENEDGKEYLDLYIIDASLTNVIYLGLLKTGDLLNIKSLSDNNESLLPFDSENKITDIILKQIDGVNL